jgi:hypothetical protein
MSAFVKNYLYELPDDIQVLIYKNVFKCSLKNISDKGEAINNFNKLVAYIKDNQDNAPYSKNHAIWSIILCNRRDIEDPYYKYFTYYADNETDFLHLNKFKLIKYDISYSTIKYIEFAIYPIQDSIPSSSYNYIKNTVNSLVNYVAPKQPAEVVKQVYPLEEPFSKQYNLRERKQVNYKA